MGGAGGNGGSGFRVLEGGGGVVKGYLEARREGRDAWVVAVARDIDLS